MWLWYIGYYVALPTLKDGFDSRKPHIMYTVRILSNIDDIYREGELVKVRIDEDGKVFPWSGGGIQLYPDEFEFVVRDETLNKLGDIL